MSICAKLRAGVVTASAEETRGWARDWVPEIPPDTVLALHGNLGVGKTTFVQGLAAGLDVVEAVTSPTFTLFNVHRGARTRLVHLDAYRLEGDASVDAMMLEDFLVSPWLLAVEWPERLGSWLPAQAWHLDLGITADARHTLRLRA
jgi:tRNA threonylcarbamoyladenosine biosynthesis protein TsaE